MQVSAKVRGVSDLGVIGGCELSEAWKSGPL